MLFFYCLKSNGAYGPYVGTYKPSLENEFYRDHHPYWKNQEQAELTKFISNRAVNSWESKFLEKWEKGVMYYALYNNGATNARVAELNKAWKDKNTSELSVYDDMVDELKDLTTTEAKQAL